MKKSMIKKINNNKLSLIISTIIIVLGLLLYFILFKRNIVEKNIITSGYSLKYDSTWKIKNKKNDSILFKHNSGSVMKFEIVTLNNEYQYLSIEEIIDDVLYDISFQNKTYKLIAKEKTLVTNAKYDGYKLLYELKDNQVMVIVGKKGNTLMLMTYEANSIYFDLLLESVYNIVNNFSLKDKEVSLNSKIELPISKIKWNDNENISSLLGKEKEYEIVNNNFLVNYTIPTNFKAFTISSIYQDYVFQDLSNYDINLNVNTFNLNIYEYLEKGNVAGSVYNNYNYLLDNSDYKNYSEIIGKLENNDYKGYIYKNSYTYIKDTYENIELIYSLDNSHIIVFKIKSINTTIPEELIEKIIIKSSKKIASYANKKIIGNNQISQLKYFVDDKKDSIKVINLKIPNDYVELDYGNNIYENKTYGLNYDDEKNNYQIIIDFKIFPSKKVALELINSNIKSYKSFGENNILKYNNSIDINKKMYHYYIGRYTQTYKSLSSFDTKKYLVDKQVYIYEIDDGKCLAIIIKGNDVKISSNIIKEVANFDINEENI